MNQQRRGRQISIIVIVEEEEEEGEEEEDKYSSNPSSKSPSNTSTNRTKQLVDQDKAIKGGDIFNRLKQGVEWMKNQFELKEGWHSIEQINLKKVGI